MILYSVIYSDQSLRIHQNGKHPDLESSILKKKSIQWNKETESGTQLDLIKAYIFHLRKS